MLVKIIKQYKDKEVGKVYDTDDLRDVSAARGQLLIDAGVAEAYTPKNEKELKGGKHKEKGKEEEMPEPAQNSKMPNPNGEWKQ